MKPNVGDWRAWFLSALSLSALVAVIHHAPIPQDPAYHGFADQRSFLHVSNFWNVVSNLPFVLVGLAGLLALRSGETPGVLPLLRAGYAAFFSAAALVGIGSGYYHLGPTDPTLIWDRLPMTLAFMAFVSIIVGEHVSTAVGQRALFPLLVIGLASVVWWRVTGDLRPYVLVQYLPLLLVPLVVILYPSKLSGSGYIWGVLASYALAKALELSDGPVFRALGVSGHTLKHLAAAGGMSLLVVAVRRRQGAVSSRGGRR